MRACLLNIAYFCWTAASMSTPAPSKTAPGPVLSLGGSTLRSLVTNAARRSLAQEDQFDLSGILWLEHINLVVGNKDLAEKFYLNVLGLTRDAGKSFHVNLGQQQFHLAETGEPAQRFAGSVGLAVPNLDSLRQRVAEAMKEGEFKDAQLDVVHDSDQCVVLRGPWGNTFYIYGTENDDELVLEEARTVEPSSMKMVNFHKEAGLYGPHRMGIRGGNPGIRFVEVACPLGKSSAVANFYRTLLDCNVWESKVEGQCCAVVEVGPGVHVVYVEHGSIPEEATQAQEGIHFCVYVNDFKNIYNRLAERNLIWTNPRFVHLDQCDTWDQAKASRTLRFKDIVDLSTGEKILELEHETRPLRHGQYLKVPKYEPK